MSVLAWVSRTYRYDQRTFWRSPQAAFFTVLLPVLMLVVFSALNGDEVADNGATVARYLLVGMVTFTLASTAYGNLAARITWRRETGIYQRLRTTPVPAWALVAGQVAGAATVVVVTLTILMAVSATFFDVALPTNWPLFVAVVLLGTASCCAIGAATSTFVRSVESADPVVFATMLPIAFISGLFDYIPTDAPLARIAELFPLRHVLLATMRSFGLADTGSLAAHLGVITLWGAVAAVVSVRRFRWSPTRS